MASFSLPTYFNVSILVIVDVSLKFLKNNNLWESIIVSILVIVDVSLKYPSPRIGKREKYGFNPCYSGCLSQIL